MSQVIVERDELTEKRLKSAEQEHKIRRDPERLLKWQNPASPALKSTAKAIGIMALPVAAFWAVLAAAAGIVVSVVGTLFRALSGLFGKA